MTNTEFFKERLDCMKIYADYNRELSDQFLTKINTEEDEQKLLAFMDLYLNYTQTNLKKLEEHFNEICEKTGYKPVMYKN